MANAPIVWIAGPVGFQISNSIEADATITRFSHVVTAARWEFVGRSEADELRRWALRFELSSRKFTVNSLNVSKWEQAHRQRLFDLYRPAAILRRDLAGRSMLAAMRSMLTDIEIAELTALAIRGGAADG
ncbi:hypothetical protein J2X65_003523 [Ancylobacter sp. 3268]|uniref:hypothetical protein n=1 Tax=Ancylobacter sp. 3268 TaxID=2817752 RepID=UPI002864DDA6|nr:hypothetical protein [Ancylobacter sp. 3268]MDR6954155.1 hypothetical protein [Ancylobacter sp. 3268]